MWIRHENMSPFVDSRVNFNYERIAFCLKCQEWTAESLVLKATGNAVSSILTTQPWPISQKPCMILWGQVVLLKHFIHSRICPTYPKLHIVPSKIKDEELKSVATFRSSRRFPSVVWRYVSMTWGYSGVIVSMSVDAITRFMCLQLCLDKG